jgi:uncharacterized membrane protein YidH (DUF202 family)
VVENVKILSYNSCIGKISKLIVCNKDRLCKGGIIMSVLNFRKHSNEKRKRRIDTIPPCFTIGVIIILLSFILIARGLLHYRYEEVTTPAWSGYNEISADSSISISKQALRSMLMEVLKPSDKEGRKKSQASIYFNTLEKYLNNNTIRLTGSQAAAIQEKLLKIQEILTGEMQTDYTLLSLDGRKIVFCLLGQIYEIYGLHMEGDAECTIINVSDSSANTLYSSNISEPLPEIQWYALVVLFICIIVLFIICFFVARRNRLFHKEETYDGFEKEKYA